MNLGKRKIVIGLVVAIVLGTILGGTLIALLFGRFKYIRHASTTDGIYNC